MVSDRAIFRAPGWSESDDRAAARAREREQQRKAWEALEEPIDAVELDDSALWRWESREDHRRAASLARAKRRARAAVHDLALSNDFRFFVTLTLDGEKINRYDEREVTRKLNTWLDNAVRRQGLKYVLVAERHKDGAIHFHGFFNDALPVVDSGTISRAGGGKPRKPRSARQREAWLAEGGHVVYNLPRWSWGFTTAIELYGERRAAVGYVCKYIAKEEEKVGGRWYYSGGALRRPEVTFCDVDFEDFRGLAGAYSFDLDALGAKVVKLTTEGGGGCAVAESIRVDGDVQHPDHQSGGNGLWGALRAAGGRRACAGKDAREGQCEAHVSDEGHPGAVPVPLLAAIRAQAGKEWAFPGRDPRKHRTRQAVWKDVKRASVAFRLPQNVAPHSFRKVYAVDLMRKYGDIERVRRALSHGSETVTMIYAMADGLLEAKQLSKAARYGRHL